MARCIPLSSVWPGLKEVVTPCAVDKEVIIVDQPHSETYHPTDPTCMSVVDDTYTGWIHAVTADKQVVIIQRGAATYPSCTVYGPDVPNEVWHHRFVV